MQLTVHQQNVDAFRDLAQAGLDLLASSQFEVLVERYGYAMAFGRDPVMAIQVDLIEALRAASGSKLLPVDPADICIVLYEENASFIHAAIDCEVATQGGRSVWINFIVTSVGTERLLTLEDVCVEGDA